MAHHVAVLMPMVRHVDVEESASAPAARYLRVRTYERSPLICRL